MAAGGLRPDLTLVLTLDAEESARRAAARDGGRPDRFGARDAAFHRRIDAAFQARLKAEPVRCRAWDVSGSAAEMAGAVHRRDAPPTQMTSRTAQRTGQGDALRGEQA